MVEILIVLSVNAQIITVNQDGTGDFTIIQDAVNTSTNGDTVLVYPGIYYENIDLTGKGIVFAGTWLLNQEDSLVHATIIDGNQTGSCIKSMSGTQWASIIGFTIQHGSGTNISSFKPYYYGNGGGILIVNSNMKVVNCRVINNFGNYGAGLYTRNSSVELSGNCVHTNWAVKSGGGIRNGSSSVIFDSINLNNFYCNYAAYGTDISIAYDATPTQIFLDTATIVEPDSYYIGKFDDHSIITDRPPISVLHGKIQQINHDLYVSPDGDNNNSGLSPDEPLKTISFAFLKIASDSLNLKTIHVADGIYSPSITGEHTPLQLKNYVNLIGQSMDNTIIDCEEKYEGARFAFGQDYTYLKNVTFLNGNGYYSTLDGGLSSGYSKKLVFDSVKFVGATGEFFTTIYSDSDDTIIMKNSSIINCKGYKDLSLFVQSYDAPRYSEFVSCIFSGNHPDTSYDKRHTSINFGGSGFNYGWNKAVFINCLFNDNTDSLVWANGGGPVALHADYGCDIQIINSTFANNLTLNNPSGGALGVAHKSTIKFYNCILFGNYAYQAYLANNTADEADTIKVNYSLVQDGQAGIRDYGAYNQLIWGEGNLDSNPLFLGSEDYPYAIDFGSPCIDAGTLDLPPGIVLPEFDLAGNPRVWGESVDMGAYEYGPWVSIKENPNSKFKIQNSKLIEVSPNPFSYGTHVSYELQNKGRLNIGVYSLSGMKVRTLANNSGSVGDKGNFYWDGSDQNGQVLPAGVYLIRMTMDGMEMGTEKVVKE